MVAASFLLTVTRRRPSSTLYDRYHPLSFFFIIPFLPIIVAINIIQQRRILSTCVTQNSASAKAASTSAVVTTPAPSSSPLPYGIPSTFSPCLKLERCIQLRGDCRLCRGLKDPDWEEARAQTWDTMHWFRTHGGGEDSLSEQGDCDVVVLGEWEREED